MRFPRMVRDLSQSARTGSWTCASTEGGIVLDRAVADGLGEPLVHALRNAIDHGLEEPGERVAAGKEPRWARSSCSARTEGGGRHRGARRRPRDGPPGPAGVGGARRPHGRGDGARALGRRRAPAGVPARPVDGARDHRRSPAGASAWTRSGPRWRRSGERSPSRASAGRAARSRSGSRSLNLPPPPDEEACDRPGDPRLRRLIHRPRSG